MPLNLEFFVTFEALADITILYFLGSKNKIVVFLTSCSGMCSVLYMKNPWATFCFSYNLKAVISRRGSHTHKSLQCIADWTILLNQPFKVRKSSRLKVDNDFSFMCNFTWVAHSCIFVFWKDCSTFFPQTPSMQQKITWVKLLHCLYIHREMVCMYICHYTHTRNIFWLLFFISSRCDFLES